MRRHEPYRSFVGYRNSLRRWLAEATPAEWDAGVTWYARARASVQELATQHGVSVDVAAGVVAVLSPMVRWERNITEANLVLKRRRRGEDFSREGHSAFAKNIHKAYDIVDMERSAGIVSGPKVTAFWALLSGPCNALVIDSIAILAAVGIDPNPLVTSEDAKPYFGRVRVMEQIRRAYRAVAEERELRPDQVQAIVWTVWRNERDKA